MVTATLAPVTLPIPPEAKFLHARGWMEFSLEKQGPAPAWTEWNPRHRCWRISMLADLPHILNEEETVAIIRHELAHIMLGHFDSESLVECLHSGRQDALIATDTAVNWFMDPELRVSISRKIAVALGLPEASGGLVDPVAVLKEIGLSGDTYVPASVVHTKLHELIEEHQQGGGEGEGTEGFGQACGGMQGQVSAEDIARAKAIAGVLGAKSEAGDAYGQLAGLGSGSMTILPPPAETPKWVRSVQEFAKSVVRSTLAERRSHNRPQPTLRALGYHTPTLRPKWASEPDTVCLLVDTSGSMMGLLPQVRPAVDYLIQHGLTVRLIAGDVQVTLDEEVKRGERFPDLIGGGGTQIVPLWDRASTYNPQAIIAFTDGYVNRWPGGSYASIKTLWVCDQAVPFGKSVSAK